MKVTIYGAGYVGLVTGACLSEVGNDVLCVDVRNAESDKKRICCRSCAELHGDNQVSKESK